MPFLPAMPDADLAENAAHAFMLNAWPVLLTRVNGAPAAVINRCTHASSPLTDGRIRRGTISCPLHGARFDLKTGACLGNTYPALRSFETRTTNGTIEINVPDTPPPVLVASAF